MNFKEFLNFVQEKEDDFTVKEIGVKTDMWMYIYRDGDVRIERMEKERGVREKWDDSSTSTGVVE